MPDDPIGQEPLPTPDDLPAELKGRRGRARTGRWPVRKPTARKQKPHGWALQNKWQPIFLEALERHGLVTPAADVAGIHPSTVANERKRSPEFDAAHEAAMERYRDAVEAEVARRAIEGIEKFVWDKKANQKVSLGKCPNDILLMFYMKKLRPEFRDNYKSDEDKSVAAAIQNLVVNFLQAGFRPDSDDQATAPTLEAFAREMPALPAPETARQRRDRLKAEYEEAERLIREDEAASAERGEVIDGG